MVVLYLASPEDVSPLIKLPAKTKPTIPFLSYCVHVVFIFQRHQGVMCSMSLSPAQRTPLGSTSLDWTGSDPQRPIMVNSLSVHRILVQRNEDSHEENSLTIFLWRQMQIASKPTPWAQEWHPCLTHMTNIDLHARVPRHTSMLT